MAHEGKLLARARVRLEQIKAGNEAEHFRRIRNVYARVPEIEEIDLTMRRQMTQLLRLAMSREEDSKKKLEALRDENLALQQRKAELLVENGWDVDYLNDIYSCPKCRDTGVFDGGVCSCLDKLYNEEMTRELSTLLQSGDESFERFDLKLYSDTFDSALNCSPRECMEKVYNACRRFTEAFPGRKANLLFRGGTGLGKTYLSACVAREIAKKGSSVYYAPVASALEAFETQKFGSDEASARASLTVNRMLECDLLILDDLGTEMLTSISMSALYTLLNTRLVNKKSMLISTNLTDEQLSKKYSAQICSRILGEFTILPFVGKDIRMMKK